MNQARAMRRAASEESERSPSRISLSTFLAALGRLERFSGRRIATFDEGGQYWSTTSHVKKKMFIKEDRLFLWS